MEWFERGFQLLFKVLFGILFSGVFAMLALETAIRRWREDRLVEGEPPATDLEAAYRRRARPATPRAAPRPVSLPLWRRASFGGR